MALTKRIGSLKKASGGREAARAVGTALAQTGSRPRLALGPAGHRPVQPLGPNVGSYGARATLFF